MPMFDAVAWLEAREPWVYRGFRFGKPHDFVAKPVSAEAMTAIQVALLEAKPTDLRRITHRALRLAFPWHPALAWTGDPVRQIEALPLGAWEAVVQSFFGSVVERSPPSPGAAASPSTSSPPPPSAPEAPPSSPTP